MRAVRLLPSLAGLSRRRIASGVSEASRFSCTECPDVLGVYDYAGPTRSSRSRCWSCCLPPFGQRRHPDCRFSKLDTQPIFSPVYASLDVSQHPAQNSGPSGSLLLSRKALSSSIPCRFSPAHPDLLFYPVSDVGETPARVADREVLHPTAQDRVDLLDHTVQRLGARDPENLFEFAQQGRPFLAFRQQQRHPSPPAIPDTMELQPEKSATLASL